MHKKRKEREHNLQSLGIIGPRRWPEMWREGMEGGWMTWIIEWKGWGTSCSALEGT